MLTSWWNTTVDDNYKFQVLGDKDILFVIKTSKDYIGVSNQIILFAKKFIKIQNCHQT